MSVYNTTLPKLFPYYCDMGAQEAATIVSYLITNDLPNTDRKLPAGSSFAVVSGIQFHSDWRRLWLSDISMRRVRGNWPNSTLKWARVLDGQIGGE